MGETDEGWLKPFYCHNTLPEPDINALIFSFFYFVQYTYGYIETIYIFSIQAKMMLLAHSFYHLQLYTKWQSLDSPT